MGAGCVQAFWCLPMRETLPLYIRLLLRNHRFLSPRYTAAPFIPPFTLSANLPFRLTSVWIIVIQTVKVGSVVIASPHCTQTTPDDPDLYAPCRTIYAYSSFFLATRLSYTPFFWIFLARVSFFYADVASLSSAKKKTTQRSAYKYWETLRDSITTHDVLSANSA